VLEEGSSSRTDRGAGDVGDRGQTAVLFDVMGGTELFRLGECVEGARDLAVPAALAAKDSSVVCKLADPVVPVSDLLPQSLRSLPPSSRRLI
jgi:hypothetical protein